MAVSSAMKTGWWKVRTLTPVPMRMVLVRAARYVAKGIAEGTMPKRVK
jgi:hypothetical protein